MSYNTRECKGISKRDTEDEHFIKFIMTSVPAGYSVLSSIGKVTVESDWKIDWGDNTETTCLQSETEIPAHKYTTSGDYTIKITGDITGLFVVSRNSCPLFSNTGISNPCLTKVVVDDESLLEAIGDYTFFNCPLLTSIESDSTSEEPDAASKVSSIGISAFEGCHSLENCLWLSMAETIGERAFYGCYKIQGAVEDASIISFSRITTIGQEAFYRCYAITSMAMSSRFLSFGDRALYGCKNLQNIQLEGERPSAGVDVFIRLPRSCHITALNSRQTWEGLRGKKWHGLLVDIINDIETFFDYTVGEDDKITITGYTGTSADFVIPSIIGGKQVKAISGFCEDNSIENVVVSEGITTIEANSFTSCSHLQSISLPTSLTTFGANVFSGCKWLWKVQLPSATAAIPEGMFQGCIYLPSITIPNTVTSIGTSAFKGCKRLKSVTLSTSAASIGDNAFENCKALETLVIPASVTYIGSAAFAGCASLVKVLFEGNAPSSGALDTAFYGDSNAIGYVRRSTTGWAYYNPLDEEPAYWKNLLIRRIWDDSFQYEILGSDSNKVAHINKFIGNETSVIVPEMIDGVKVTTIKENVFARKSTIESVTIAPSIEYISKNAFLNCSALTTVKFAGNAPIIFSDAFDGCPSNCTAFVQYNALGWGTNFPSKIAGITVEYDPDSIFDYTVDDNSQITITSLKVTVDSVIVPQTIFWKPVKVIGDNAFSGVPILSECIIKADITSIGSHAFFNTSLNKISIPPSVTSIGDYAFSGTQLTEAIIPSTVTTIGEHVFTGCAKLRRVVLPSTITTIPEGIFSECESLVEFTIPSGVTSIGDYAFDGCKVLPSISLPAGVSALSIGMCRNASALTEFTIPESATIIPKECFKGCTSLEYVKSYKAAAIGDSAFYGCIALKEFEMPTAIMTGVTPNVGDSAFLGCTSMKKAFLHESLSSIGASAFSGCAALTYVIIKGSEPTVGSSAFASVPLTCQAVAHGDTSGWTLSNGKWNGLTLATDYTSVYQYTILEKEIRIDKYIGGTISSLEMPDDIIGIPVTIIGASAFEGSGQFTIAKFPSQLKEIDDRAFYGAFSDITAHFPESLMRIGEKAFVASGSSDIHLVFLGDAPACDSLAFSKSPNTSSMEFFATIKDGTIGWAEKNAKIQAPYLGEWNGIQVSTATETV